MCLVVYINSQNKVLMNKKLLSLMLVVLNCTMAWSANGDTFTRVTSEGVLLKYKVTDETNKECMVGTDKSSLGLACETSTTGTVTIPSNVNGYSVTSIGFGAFDQCRISGISIPNTVRTIYGRAFNDCLYLHSIYIPSSVTDIAASSSSNYAFSPKYLTNIVVADGNSTYDSRNGCNAIIKKSTGTLIYGCDNTIIPNDIDQIGPWAFSGCNGLTDVTIPNGIWRICERAFASCPNLVSVTIPESVTRIDSYAFGGCSNLSDIDIPQSILGLGTSVFNGTAWEKNLPDGLKYIGKVVYKYIGTMPENTSIVIKEGTTSICGNAFTNGSNLISVSIPNSVTNIGEGAFMYCGFSSVTIPSSVTIIGKGAFWSCYNLTSVIAKRPTPININNVFSDVDKITLYVPYGSKEKYEKDYYWKQFKEIIEMKDNITIAAAGIGTYCSTQALDFSGTDDIKAYIVSAFKPSTGEVTLTRITDVPANTGIVVKGDADTYSIPWGPGETIVSNMLVGVTENTVLNKVNGDYTNYILAKKNGNLGFYAVADGTTLSAGKAYLPLPTASLPSGARDVKFVFDDEQTTDITEVEHTNTDARTEVYDLQGRKVRKPAKGLYIVNGKKVTIK